MVLTRGARVGSYEITARIGVGGMGEVYRATDTTLKRQVALKVLPADVARDAERLARFQREAEVLASLNHPNIAVIHGLERFGGQTALVMELVEGSTLAHRIARGPIPVDEALPLARQVAEALEAAHERGIVHRDLKPANVMVTPAGLVKILDFGLATADGVVADSSETAATTVPGRTRLGIVLGTPAYMSPEQARGLATDRRTDIWSFGCVLYEMLAGQRTFLGSTAPDTVAAVLDREPDWTRLPAGLPATIRRLLERCLEKTVNRRLRDIGDVRILIDDALVPPEAPSAPSPESRRMWPWTATAAAALLAAGIPVAYWWLKPAPFEPPVRVSIAVPGQITPQLSGIVSPDGAHVAFVATGASGRSMLWVRPLESLEAREIPGTDRAAHPFWAPDGRSMGFIADSRLKRVDLAGGPVQTLAETGPFRSGASWSRSGEIVYSSHEGTLSAVPASGGPVRAVVEADAARGDRGVAWPDFLPDGRRFLYFVHNDRPDIRGVYVGSIDGSENTLVINTDVRAKYAEPGYLLFLRDETILAQPFDAERLVLSGEPVPIADRVWFARVAAQASFSTSRTGVLAYVNASLWNRQPAWFDRAGRPLGPLGPPYRDATVTPQIAPDGRSVATGRGEMQLGDIWIVGADATAPRRVTFNSEGEDPPVWSADGRRLLIRSGPRLLIRNLADGSDDPLMDLPGAGLADWSRDGRFVLLTRLAESQDLWVVDLEGDRRPTPYLATPANEAQAQISPDGRWVAYTSNESGRDEVYVQSFPQPGRKRQISVDGGAMPRWRRSGGELFFLATGQTLTSVRVRDSASLDFGPPTPLFRTRLIVQGSESSVLPTAYDVTADGQRFLISGPPESPEPPMTVVLNWWSVLPR